MSVRIGNSYVGDNNPVYIIAEIGLNHNGDIEIAKSLIDVACLAGCNAVKFQKRTPLNCVPQSQRDVLRETPWGIMTYLEYRYRVEFDFDQYKLIDEYCKFKGIEWFASCWDEDSVDFIESFNPVCYKVASASLTDYTLLNHLKATKRPIIISTGMSTMDQIESAFIQLEDSQLLIAHATSTYPCKPEELNLKMITTLKNKYSVPIGYSGHEHGLQASYAAVALGSTFVERHITLDRTMWGSDQAASLEPSGLIRLVRDIRIIESALGDGIKKVYDSEKSSIEKLRKFK